MERRIKSDTSLSMRCTRGNIEQDRLNLEMVLTSGSRHCSSPPPSPPGDVLVNLFVLCPLSQSSIKARVDFTGVKSALYLLLLLPSRSGKEELPEGSVRRGFPVPVSVRAKGELCGVRV